ncbi:hypothetical protein EC100833_3067, partial [Escherichia coli 10.0833]
MITLACSG